MAIRRTSRFAQGDLDGEPEQWARFLEAVERQGDVFGPTRPDPRWTPTTTGEPPYSPGVYPEVWPTPRPEPSHPGYGTLAEWMAYGGVPVGPSMGD